jgi:endonuclease-3 related protein
MAAVILERAGVGARWPAALEGLEERDLLAPEPLAQADFPEIVDALREKGINATARMVAPLKHLARFLAGNEGEGILPRDPSGTTESAVSLETLRGELSAIKGIGPAGADAIALFALDRPSYPVDRATFRVMVRHGWLDASSTYDEARDLIVGRAMERAEDRDERAARELVALSLAMAQFGRQYCRAAAPRCAGCPLEHLLPEGGPREVDG